jgi:hypothetical protein
VLIPWSAFWERNYFAEASAAFAAFFRSNYTRGAVTGLGLINVYAALAELSDLFGRKSDNLPSETDLPPGTKSEF